MSSNFSNPIEKKALEVLSKFPFVKIYDTVKLNLHEEWQALNHCIFQAHLEKKAEWVVDFDIDEVFAFGDAALKTSPDCKGGEDDIPAQELSRFASGIPSHVLAVILPRVIFGQNGVQAPPDRGTQMDLYTRRGNDEFQSTAKVLLRTNTGNMTKLVSKHSVYAVGQDAVIYPCGKSVPSQGECEDSGMCDYHFKDKEHPANVHLSAPRLHHYQPRSWKECWQKVEDTKQAWFSNNDRRAKNAEAICSESSDNAISDYSVYCASKAVERELTELFPLFDNAPYVL
jgi:hypothetical protein